MMFITFLVAGIRKNFMVFIEISPGDAEIPKCFLLT